MQSAKSFSLFSRLKLSRKEKLFAFYEKDSKDIESGGPLPFDIVLIFTLLTKIYILANYLLIMPAEWRIVKILRDFSWKVAGDLKIDLNGNQF